MYNIREARETDRDAVVTLLTKALRPLETFREEWVEAWRKYWYQPEYEDWAYVATYNGRVVANFSFAVNDGFNTIRGALLRIGTVWAVGTEAEHRRKGLMKTLLKKAFSGMKEKGIVLSILDPSPYQGAQIAYEKCGYALAEKRVTHVVPPNALRPTKENQNKNVTVRELTDSKEWKKLSELEASMCRYGSRLLTFPAIFMQQIQSGHFYILERDSTPVGCIKLTSTFDNTTLTVSKTYFTLYEVIPSIIELIMNTSSQISSVEWTCEPQIPVQYYVHNIHKLKTHNTGTMMMRVVNFKEYCRSIQVPENAQEKLTVELTDTQCPWNEGIYDLNSHNGTLTVERTDKKTAEVTLNPFQLSQVVSGFTFPSILQKLKMISCSPRTAKTLDALFPVDSFMSYFRF